MTASDKLVWDINENEHRATLGTATCPDMKPYTSQLVMHEWEILPAMFACILYWDTWHNKTVDIGYSVLAGCV